MKTSSGPDATPWKTSSLTLLGEAWILTVAPVFWPCNRTRLVQAESGITIFGGERGMSEHSI